MRAFILGLAGLLCASPALAQSAEETVAFMMMGAEDGSTETFLKGGQWSKLSDNPAKFSLIRKSLVIDLTISQSSDCIYKYKIETFDDAVRKGGVDATLDFSHAAAPIIVAGEFGLKVKIPGLKSTCDTKDADTAAQDRCARIGSTNYGDADRLANAFAYFKTNFCKGSAF